MRLSRFFLFFILGALFFSCGDKKESTEADEINSTASPIPGMTKDIWTFEGKAFGIFHEVKDFDSWKAVFDEDEPRRETSGFKFLSILRSVEQENSIAIFFMTPDHKAAKDFISDDLHKKMDEAGVTSEPSFIMYDVIYLTSQDYSSIPYRIAASYKVKNYKTWLEKYVADTGNKAKAGITDIAAARSPESHRMVYIMTAAKTLEEAQAFIEKEFSPERMSEYGAIDEPAYSLWKRADYID